MSSKINKFPLLPFVISYLAGILAAKIISVSLYFCVLSCFIFVFIFILYTWKKNRRFGEYILIVSIFMMGGMNYNLHITHSANHIKNIPKFNTSMEMQACVDRVYYGNSTYKKLRLKNLKIISGQEQEIQGKILLYIKKTGKNYLYGDKLRFTSTIEKLNSVRNPGVFDYQKYLRRRNIYATMWLDSDRNLVKQTGNIYSPGRLANIVKLRIMRIIERATNKGTASILKALLTGNRAGIEEETEELFANSGVLHVLAVSGLHVGYITLIFLVLFGFLRIPVKIRYVLTIFILWFYAAVVNFRPSVVRAVTMAGCFLGGKVLERKVQIYNIIAFAAFLQTLINPVQLFSIGFQLSFVAVLSIVYINNRFDKLLPKKWQPKNISNKSLRYIWQLFLVSLAAQLGVFPLIMFYFQKVSFIAAVLNILVVPLVSIIGALGFAQVLLGFLWNGFYLVYGEVQNYLILILKEIIRTADSFAWSYTQVPQIPFFIIIIIYIGIFILLNFNRRRIRATAAIFMMSIANLWVWKDVLQKPYLKTVFFDLGQGESSLIQLPSDKNILVDCGEKGYYENDAKKIISKYLEQQGIDTIDLLILSHLHNDHVGGANYLLNNFNIKRIWSVKPVLDTQKIKGIASMIDSLDISIRYPEAGDSHFISKRCVLKVYHPDENFSHVNCSQNNNSLVVKISYGEMDLLFTGDIEEEAENYLTRLNNELEAEIIKVPHHGSSTSSTSKFIQNVSPELAIITGGDSRIHNSLSRTIERYTQEGIEVKNTNKCGAIMIKTYKNKWKLSEWRK